MVLLCSSGIFFIVWVLIFRKELVVLRILVSSLWGNLLSEMKWCSWFWLLSCSGCLVFVGMG